jgi:hypothetical protein
MELQHKGYFIKSDKHFPSLLTISTTGRGGKIPSVMEGLFTSVGDAKQVIDSYTEGKDVGKEKRES